jgi:glycosyltransferase involved in cell wall biosynthesis
MLSVVINAKNEQEVIKTCFESIKWADEIIVLLNDSSDSTEEIAKKYTKNIHKISGQDFAKVKNLGLERALGDWILFVDADERVTKSLKTEIQQLISNDDSSAYAISRINIFFGQKVNYGPYEKDWVIRLVKKEKAKSWVGSVHEHLEFDGNLGYTKNSFLHLTHRGVDHFVLKALEWSTIDAKLRFDANHPKMSGWRFFRIFITEIFNQGIRRKGFFGGTVGIIDSLLQSFSMFITYIRLWQMQQLKPIEQTYQDIDKKLIESDFEY